MVLKGASKANLEKSICMETLSDEGDQKFRILSGHRDTHFRRLRQLGTGSEVTLEHLDGSTTRYRVVDIDSVARDGLARYFANQRNREWIALLTCYPFRFIGPAPERFIAWAAPVAAGVN
jgi:sortase A